MTTNSLMSSQKTYLLPALLVTLLGFFPVGIFAVKYALDAKEHIKAERLDKANVAAKKAKKLSIIGASVASTIYLFGLFGWVYLSLNVHTTFTPVEILSEVSQ